MEKLVMSVPEMAKALGISAPKAYDLTHIEGFPLLMVGKRRLAPVEAFKKWLDKQTGGDVA